MNSEAMRHLKKEGYVIYLESAHESIVKRCEIMRVNRIVGQSSYSLSDILQFRRGVYEKWYDSKIKIYDGMRQDEIADEIIRELKFGVQMNTSTEEVEHPNK